MLGIPKDVVHELPEVHYPGRVFLVDSAARAKSAVAYLKTVKQIGFDTETRPSFQKNHHYKVSLVQLSVPGECFLFRLKQIGSLDGLISILEDPNIQKIGLSLKDDFHSLAKLTDFTPAGFVELQTFVKRYEIADNSLQKIFALIFNQRISKNQRLTNWEALELTVPQQQYAAIDAWACVEIYNHLLAGKFDPSKCPYTIDDETATMLQNSVGIHKAILNPDDVPVESVELPPELHTYRRLPAVKSAENKEVESKDEVASVVEVIAENPAEASEKKSKTTRKRKAPAKKAAEKATAKKSAEKATAKKTTAKKTTAKKATEKPTAKKPTAKKTAAKKTTKKAPAKKAPAAKKRTTKPKATKAEA